MKTVFIILKITDSLLSYEGYQDTQIVDVFGNETSAKSALKNIKRRKGNKSSKYVDIEFEIIEKEVLP